MARAKSYASYIEEIKLINEAKEKIREAYMSVANCVGISDNPEYEEIADELLNLKSRIANIGIELTL